MQNVWEESIKMNHATRFTNICTPLFSAPKKHVLNNFALFHTSFIWNARITQKYSLPSHVILYLLQEIKDDLEPSTRSHAIPGIVVYLDFLFLYYYDYFFFLSFKISYTEMLNFNLRVVSKSPTEMSPPIGALLELLSRANLPCLLKLALNLLSSKDALNWSKVTVKTFIM